MSEKKSLPKSGYVDEIFTGVPIRLTEVSENYIDFNSASDASKFLGVHSMTVLSYTKQKTKIIKSKLDGKIYLIKRLQQ